MKLWEKVLGVSIALEMGCKIITGKFIFIVVVDLLSGS
jgi:hypothetical protein